MIDKIYEVKEYSLTFQVLEGQSFPTRVGRVGDHYEIVGGNVYVMPIKLSFELEELLKKQKIKWNPKEVWKREIKGSKPKPRLDDFPTLAEAEAELDYTLKKYDLHKFVNTSIIKDWVYNGLGTTTQISTLLISLLNHERCDLEHAIKDILDKINRFYNVCPNKILNGKSPLEMLKFYQYKRLLPNFRLEINKIRFPELHKKYHEFIVCLSEKRDYKNGLKKINKIFKFMLENKITHPELYRLYANKATCHLALDNFEKGKFFLEIATKLNPHYKFAQRQLEKVKQLGFVWEVYVDGYIERDIGYQYYEFILPFRINFAQEVVEIIL